MRPNCLIFVLAMSAIAAPSLPCLADGRPKVAAKGMDKEKEQAIRRLLDLTGAGQLGVQVMSQMFGTFKTTMPKVPESFWQEFMKEVNPDDLVNLIVPIYDRHLSLAEVNEVIRFYETPAGKKLITVLPQITTESMQAGRQWGGALAARVIKQLKEKGLDKQP